MTDFNPYLNRLIRESEARRLSHLKESDNTLIDLLSEMVKAIVRLEKKWELKPEQESAASLPPTTEKATKDSPSDVVQETLKQHGRELGRLQEIIFTTPLIQPSSQSVQEDTEIGPAEQNSECAHEWMWIATSTMTPAGRKEILACLKCPALRFKGQILVPAAQTSLSTSQKPEASQSADSSEIVRSLSPSRPF